MSTAFSVDTRQNLRILILVTWYAPHLSGLTVAVRRLAEGFQARGHSVTVVTSQHAHHLPEQEVIEGVSVIRAKVAARMSKGFLMPGFLSAASELIDAHDLVVAVLPAGPFECLAMRLAARRRPTVIEYICDIRLPAGWVNRVIEHASNALFRWTAQASSAVVFSSPDYASTSPFRHVCTGKTRIAPFPIAIAEPDPAEVARLRAYGSPAGGPILGMAGRLAYGKGFELLVDALPLIRKSYPNVRVMCAGEHDNVVGEEAYKRRILPRLEQLGDHWQMLGVVQPNLASFFAACDLLVFPSTNRTESFGMVQAEAMLCGVPVVASDLPGIRVAVQTTGMGKLFEAGNVPALAEAVVHVLDHRCEFIKPPHLLRSKFSTDIAVEKRLDVYLEHAAASSSLLQTQPR